MIASLDQLSPAARSVADEFLATIPDADQRAERHTHLLDHLGAGAGAGEVAALVADLTAPDALAATGGRARADGARRPPLPRRLREAWWDPENPKVLVPRVLGWGVDVNLGAVAVRLGLLEPDGQDQPLDGVPEPALLAALAGPVLLTAGIAGSYARERTRLPRELPVHWDARGRADRRAGHGPAVGVPFGAALAGSALAAATTLAGRPVPERAAATGAAWMFAIAGAGVWACTVTDTGEARPLAGPALALATLGVPLGVLTALARAGRRAEIRRDLGGR